MAEWSNAVDSKSIVLFTGYLGFESLSLRHLPKAPPSAGFLVNVEECWDLNPRNKGLTNKLRFSEAQLDGRRSLTVRTK